MAKYFVNMGQLWMNLQNSPELSILFTFIVF